MRKILLFFLILLLVGVVFTYVMPTIAAAGAGVPGAAEGTIGTIGTLIGIILIFGIGVVVGWFIRKRNPHLKQNIKNRYEDTIRELKDEIDDLKSKVLKQ